MKVKVVITKEQEMEIENPHLLLYSISGGKHIL